MAGSWEGLVKCRLKQHKVLLLFSWPFTLFHIHFGYSKSGKNSTTKHPTVTNQNSSTRNGLLLLCDKTFPGEMLHTYLFTPDRDPMTDQSVDATKVQPGKAMSVVAYLQEMWVTGYGDRNDSKTAASVEVRAFFLSPTLPDSFLPPRCPTFYILPKP